MNPAAPVTRSRMARKASAADARMARHARRPSRQCGRTGAPPLAAQDAYAGRGAGRPSSSVVIRRTRHSMPASSKIASAKSAQVQSPSAARCQMPFARSASTSSCTASARCPTNVGQPRWSSTTATSSRSAASRSIVRTKLWPVCPKSHELRTIQASAPAAASPSSFERPYAESGLGRSDSTYGSRLRPSKT